MSTNISSISPATDVSVIIVSYNTQHLLQEAVEKLDSAANGLIVQRIFVDNNSSDQSVAVIRHEFSNDRLIVNTTNVGFGRANNQALPFVNGRYVLLLNTDAFVAPDTLRKTVAYMDAHPRCGILGVRLEGRDGLLQPCARYFPTPWNTFLQRTGLNIVFKSVQLIDDLDWDHGSVRACDWVVGCYYLVRKEVIEQVGLFDPRYFLYFEEVDHCFAAKKAGWDVVFYPHTTVVHIGGESAKSVGEITKGGRQLEGIQVESELLYFRKNLGLPLCILHLLLSFLAAMYVTLKQLIKAARAGRRPAGIASPWQHAVMVSRLFWRTQWATTATR